MPPKNSAVKLLTGKDEKRAGRINVLLPESEFRYVYAIMTEHNPLCDTGREAVARLIESMGKTIDKWNAR